MLYRNSTRAMAQLAALLITLSGAQAFDDAKYPNLKGQWDRFPIPVPGQPSFDQTKGWGRLQEAPLIPEYQKILRTAWPIKKPEDMAITSIMPSAAYPA